MGLANIRYQYKLTQQEVYHYIVVILCLSFIFSFDKWGMTTFNVTEGLNNWIIAIFIATIAILVHDFGHRIVAIRQGEKIEFKLSKNSLLLSFLFAVLSNGAFTFLLGGYLKKTPSKRLKLGRYPGLNDPVTLWILSIAGPLANLVLAVIATFLMYAGAGNFFYQLAVFSGLYGLFTLLPIPPFDGFHVFYYSRSLFAGISIAFLVYAVLLMAGTPSFLIALFLGIAASLCWWFAFEK